MLTYNAAPFVREAIDSVLAQQVDFPVELVIGDDCSTDGTRDILREYARRYPEVVRLHLHEVHGAGIPGRVNNVHNLTSCRGRYVALLDGDDYWLTTEKLARQVTFLEASPAHVAVASDGIVLEEGRRYAALPADIRGRDTDFDELARRGVFGITPSGLVFRRGVLLPLPPWFGEIVLADHYIFSILLRRGRCRILAERYFCYRRHASSFSATYLGGRDAPFRLYDDLQRHRATFPEIGESWLLDWRDVRAMVGVAAGGLRRADAAAFARATRRLGRMGGARIARATTHGVGAYLRKRLSGIPLAPPPLEGAD